MSEPGAVKQKDLFPRNGIKPAEAKSIRDRLLTDDDWYKEGTTIWIRQSGIQRLSIAEQEPKLAQTFVELQGLVGAANKSYVYCRLRGVSQKIPCAITRKIGQKALIGKKFRAEERIDEDGNRSYRHASMAKPPSF